MKISEYARHDGLGLAQLVKSRQVSPREPPSGLGLVERRGDRLDVVGGQMQRGGRGCRD